ncbi:hypothetical protein BDZ45DRAFT_755081 [Acephala macrosclerotiorum]|nr:hypothetical protein BDZ45DRAFT_755081 [Acephala macrosclerotiorum]
MASVRKDDAVGPARKDSVRKADGNGEDDPPPPTDPVPDEEPVLETAPGYKIPDLTFGLEMEMSFAVRKRIYNEWLAQAQKGIDYATDDESDLRPLARAQQIRRRARAAEEAVAIERELYGEGAVPDNNTSRSSETISTGSTDSGGRLRILGYLRAYLNHKTGDTVDRASLLGEIPFDDPKQASSLVWHLTKDDSVMPQRKHLLGPLKIEDEAAQKEYRVVGAELVSSVLDFDKISSWYPKLQQLEEDLTFDPRGDKGAWFMDVRAVQTHLHVHFGIKDEEISVDVAKNVCVLYGLFENEIESWLPISQRDNEWCGRLRRGMERERLGYLGNRDDVALYPGKRYTPSGYADLIYGCRNLEELKTITSGFSTGEWIGGPDQDDTGPGGPSRTIVMKNGPDGILERNWIAVNLSLKRTNKPFTIEFRQHHGLMDPESIAWWVRFVGKLIRFAHYLAKKGIKIQHTGAPEEDSFVDELPKRSILELLGFPEEGIAHFHRMRAIHFNEEHHLEIIREDEFVRRRIVRRKLGEETGEKMDNDIRREDFGEPDNVGPVSQCPGEEECTVPLTGQDLTNRILWITLVQTHGPFTGRERFLQAYNTRQASIDSITNGIDYTTADGFQRFYTLITSGCDARFGLGRVWLDAMGMVKVLECRRQQRENNILEPEMMLWERRFMFYTQIQLNDEAVARAEKEAEEQAAGAVTATI